MKPFLLPDMWFETNTTTQDNDPANDYLDATEASQMAASSGSTSPPRRNYTYVRYGRARRAPDMAAAARGTPMIGGPR